MRCVAPPYPLAVYATQVGFVRAAPSGVQPHYFRLGRQPIRVGPIALSDADVASLGRPSSENAVFLPEWPYGPSYKRDSLLSSNLKYPVKTRHKDAVLLADECHPAPIRRQR